MKLIYNANYKTLRKENGEQIELSKLESKLIEALSYGGVFTWKDLYQYIYKDDDRFYPKDNANHIKNRLINKIYIDIRNIRGIGLEIRDEILLDYI